MGTLTKIQLDALLRVERAYSLGAPLYSPGVGQGTRKLAWSVKVALVNAGLIEIFDWETESRERGIRGAVPPFIFYRPTPIGRERAVRLRETRADREAMGKP